MSSTSTLRLEPPIPISTRRKTQPILIPQPLGHPAGHTLLSTTSPTLRQSRRSYMLGERVSAADLAAYPTIWFLDRHGRAEAERLLPIRQLRAWYERVKTLGHGRPTGMSAAMALDIAREASPQKPELPANGGPSEIKDGTRVTVMPDDTGRDSVEGVLVAASDQEVVISRSDERVGEVFVHFPRAGYDIVAI
jgi:hypothetical protein